MKKIFVSIAAIILLAAAPLSSVVGAIGAVDPETALYPENGEIVHFFTHALIAYPEIAFKENNGMRMDYDTDCLTVKEFKAILSSLHKRGYALCDITSTYKTENGASKRTAFPFFKNKKPLVLSFDDINYYVKKMHLGMNDKLALDKNGRLCTFTQNAKAQINYGNEVVTVLENFIAEHPDFSFRGARGLLCLTGFDGVLGYRTQEGGNDRAREIVKAKKVIAKLKSNGWKFACHSYGHYHMNRLSEERFAADTDKWLKEVRPLVGKTDIYVYPYGEWERPLSASKKHSFLRKRGFDLFCGVGTAPYYTSVDSGALFFDRKPMDGYSLRHHAKTYFEFFDCESVFDTRRPKKFSEK